MRVLNLGLSMSANRILWGLGRRSSVGLKRAKSFFQGVRAQQCLGKDASDGSAEILSLAGIGDHRWKGKLRRGSRGRGSQTNKIHGN